MALFAIIFGCSKNIVYGNSCVGVSEEVTLSQEEMEKAFEILEFINISEDGHVYTKEDFTTNYDSDITNFAIFTNKTLTINCDFEQNANNKFTININSLLQNQLEEYEYYNQAEEKICWVLDTSKLVDDKENYVYIKVEQTIPRSPSNPTEYVKIYEFKFFVIQTPVNFEKESSNLSNNFIVWEYVYNNQEIRATSPTNGENYHSLTLTFPSGTKLNPVYVKFNYSGEEYVVYRYRYQDNEVEKVATFNASTGKQLDLDKLVFNKSGRYSVQIYDKTIETNCLNKNFFEYNFTIENPNSDLTRFYIDAHTSDKTPIMRNQITNEDVILDFVHFENIKALISQIKVIRSYQPSISQSIPVVTTYEPSELPSSLLFTQDGNYEINFINNQGTTVFSYEFIILKSIKQSFQVGDKTYSIGEDKPSNLAEEHIGSIAVSTMYNDIEGKTTYSFKVIVARSAPSIDGINNNARTQNAVSLSVRGVGNIKVQATLNGKPLSLPSEVENGDRLQTFTAQGKYLIQITDEMGSTITKSFTKLFI